MKKCPFCAEEIQDDALKCRFCGEFIKKKKKWWQNCLIGCLLAFVLSMLSFILLVYFSFLMLKFILYKLFFAGPGSSPHFYYPPFTGPGMENMFRDFGEFLRQFWGKLMEWFHYGGNRVI